MRQAIETKYIGHSNTRGARVKASAQAGSITIPWDDALDTDGNHDAAARALAHKLHWTGKLVGGGLKRGNCYVFHTDTASALVDLGKDVKRDVKRIVKRLRGK
jgi:hypothetical protein